jgi:ubiquinone/menaquinone biosynthesis C-methylase UbiE
MMSEHKSHNEAILDQFTKQAESYANLVASLPQSNRRAAAPLDAIGALPSDDVLDVACGSGSLTLELARRTRHVTGIDLTAAMIDQARARQAQAGITNVSWQLGDVLPLPFRKGSFSLVVSQAAFHHFSDPVAVLAEMARVCAPGGRIAVNDLGPDPESADHFNEIEKLRDPSHVRALPPTQLRSLGQQIGLVEKAFCSQFTPKIALETILATSFPNPGDLDTVRAAYRADAQSGHNKLGLKAEFMADQIMIQYPMTFVVWEHASSID